MSSTRSTAKVFPTEPCMGVKYRSITQPGVVIIPGNNYCSEILHFVNIQSKRSERPTIVGGLSVGSRNGASSRKGCVVDVQVKKASNR